jgi:hypothetical protein
MNKSILMILVTAVLLVALVLGVLLVIGRAWPPRGNGDGKTTDTLVVLEAIDHVNKQVFIEYYIAVDVNHTEAPLEWIVPFVKQEFIVLIRGRVPAGLDLEQLAENDIWISSDGTRVQLTLPAPVVFENNVSIDFENSYILYRRDTCPGFLCQDALEAYQSEVLPYGRDRLIEYALKSGILEQAARDGKAYYEQLLKSLGFEEVRVIVTGYGL